MLSILQLLNRFSHAQLACKYFPQALWSLASRAVVSSGILYVEGKAVAEDVADVWVSLAVAERASCDLMLLTSWALPQRFHLKLAFRESGFDQHLMGYSMGRSSGARSSLGRAANPHFACEGRPPRRAGAVE